MSKIATIKKHPVQCAECQRCRQPISLVRTATIGFGASAHLARAGMKGKGSRAPAAP